MNNQKIRSAATRRLMRDLREWKSSQHLAKSITATPLDNDIFQWHVNFFPDCGPLRGIIFHLIITFPSDYPERHPKVSIRNTLCHPNVFGESICLDMLKTHGWCRAYSVSSVLFQLLSFLVTDKAPQDYGPPRLIQYSKAKIDTMRTQSAQFTCECGHTFTRPYPPISSELSSLKIIPPPKSRKKIKNRISNKKGIANTLVTFAYQSQKRTSKYKKHKSKSTVNYWDKTMSADVENIVVQFLNVSDLILFGRVCNRFKQIVKGFSKYILMTRFNCWYHRIDVRYSEHLRSLKPGIDDIARNVILGYGINPEFYANTITTNNKPKIIKKSKGDKNYKNKYDKQQAKQPTHYNIPKYPALKSCQTVFHLISYDAYHNHKINCTPTKDKHFAEWIPMYILHKRYHGKSALKMVKKCTLNVFKRSAQFSTNTTPYHPMMSIELITCIMSSLVVVLMDSIRSKQVHHSINVMETYYHYFHLLLAVYHDNYKVLRDIINDKCLGFIRDINKRIKKRVPNLGYFMIWFLLFECPPNVSSSDIFKALLQELLVRNVKWLIKEYGQSYEAQTMDSFDIKLAWKGSFVGLRLFLFQYFFMVKCCDVGVISPTDKFKELNKNLGCVSEDITRKLQIFCQKTLSGCHNWSDFFRIVNIRYPSKFGMQCWLRRSVFISAERRYHYYTWENLNSNKDLKPLCEKLFFEAVSRNEINTIKMLLNIENENENGYDTDSECDIDDNETKEEFQIEVNDENNNITEYRYSIMKSTISQYLNTKREHNPDWDISKLTNYRKLENSNGNTPLLIAMQNGNKDMIELLIAQGFDVAQMFNMCDRLLIEAVKMNDINTVKWCLRIDDENNESESESEASESDSTSNELEFDYELVEYNKQINMMKLFNKYSDNNYVPHKNTSNLRGRGLISIAAGKCHAEMVKLLCEQQFDVNMIDMEKKTALRYAQNGRDESNKKKMNYIIKLIKKRKKKQKSENDLKVYKSDSDNNDEIDEKSEPYTYGNTGFDIWIQNNQQPIYSNTILKCTKIFHGNKQKVKDLLINIGYFEENTIKNIRFIAEIPNDETEQKVNVQSNGQINGHIDGNVQNKKRKRNRNRRKNKSKNIENVNVTNGNINHKTQSKSNKRNRRRKINKKMNRYCLIIIDDCMDEIYDSMYRINSTQTYDIMEIVKQENIANNMKEHAPNCRLYIENFDIVDETCHYKLTQLLLRYGQLKDDIIIGIDEQNNPFCRAHFRRKDDAIGCKQASLRKLMFGNKILKITYSTQKCNVNNSKKRKKIN